MTVDLDVTPLVLQVGERVDVLQVLAPSGQGPESSVTVSLGKATVNKWMAYLVWRHDGETQKADLEVPDRFTLVLGVDRGRESGTGLLTLAVAGSPEPPLQLGPIDLESFPVSGSPAARVRFGVPSTKPIDLGVGELRGRLRFRPVAIESGWGRP